MSHFRSFFSLFLASLALTMFTACVDDHDDDNHGKGNGKGNGNEDAHAGHDHDHSHESAPNGGHFINVGAPFKVEWNHEDEQGVIDVHLLDSEGKKSNPQEKASVKIVVTHGDKTNEHTLDPVVQEESESTAVSHFTFEDKVLLELVKGVSEVINAKLVIRVGNVEYSGDFESHEAHDH